MDDPDVYWWPGVEWTNEGLVMTVTNETGRPYILVTKYLFFGRVDVTLKALPGIGIGTVIALDSDDGDQIDWVWRASHLSIPLACVTAQGG